METADPRGWPELLSPTCWAWFDGEINKKTSNKLAVTGKDEVGGKNEKCLCVRQKNCLSITMESGVIHYIALPFLVVLHSLLHELKKKIFLLSTARSAR